MKRGSLRKNPTPKTSNNSNKLINFIKFTKKCCN